MAARISSHQSFSVVPEVQNIGGNVSASLRRASAAPTNDLPLWVVIRNSTEALSFNHYQRFIDYVLCNRPLGSEAPELREGLSVTELRSLRRDVRDLTRLPFTSHEAYKVLKIATEAFVHAKCGVALDSYLFTQADHDYLEAQTGLEVNLDQLWDNYTVAINGSSHETLPYLALVRNKLRDLPIKHQLFATLEDSEAEACTGVLERKLVAPCLIELIWCYFMEQSGLIQAIQLIARRFQNVRGPGRDPLAHMEIGPLRPLTSLLWGFVAEEPHRLTVRRRGFEYWHAYALALEGKAVGTLQPADARLKFLEAFHNLLYLCTRFFEVDDKTTVHADGFPLLNALREVHIELSQGAHNQFGDMPVVARSEFLMVQWLLARPELQEFLPSRVMTPTPEPWMGALETMRKLQGWGSVSPMHFRTLAMGGERLLLSIRFGSWVEVSDPNSASNWARFFRSDILSYIHAYRALTGVDLSTRHATGKVDTTQPSVLMRRQLSTQRG